MAKFVHGTSLRCADAIQSGGVIGAGLYVYPPRRSVWSYSYAIAAAQRDASTPVLLTLHLADDALEDAPETRGPHGWLCPDELVTIEDVPTSAILEVRDISTSREAQWLAGQTGGLLDGAIAFLNAMRPKPPLA